MSSRIAHLAEAGLESRPFRAPRALEQGHSRYRGGLAISLGQELLPPHRLKVQDRGAKAEGDLTQLLARGDRRVTGRARRGRD